jgi:hypothetical protein
VETISKKTTANTGAADAKERLDIIEYALYANTLLEPAYFYHVGAALAHEDLVAFKAQCVKAGIPEDYHEALYKIFMAGPKDLVRMW